MPAETLQSQRLEQSRSYAFAGAFFDELRCSGVRRVCISPGSRSTPLTVAALQSGLDCESHLDERSASFFALGVAKADRRPVALICTSGTAAANYLPAVVEANHAGVPLLVLTADRPPELREWGAGQTIDQLKIYGSNVRWFAELPVLDGGEDAGPDFEPMLRYARSLACRSVAECRGTSPGPVHLNWPLREPLEPRELSSPPEDGASSCSASPPRSEVSSELGNDVGSRSAPAVSQGRLELSSETIDRLATWTRSCDRGLIVCGPMDGDQDLCSSIAELARVSGWPIHADPTSQMRRGPHTARVPILAAADFLWRDREFSSTHVPDAVVYLGSTPASKALRLWREAHPPTRTLIVDPAGVWHDPSHLASEFVRADPTLLCRAWARAIAQKTPAATASAWLSDLVDADRQVCAAIEAALLDEPELREPRAVRELAELLPDGSILYTSNSMPVRLLDSFLPAATTELRVLSNRGANGIDGMLSSALGAASTGRGPTVLLTGDLAFLHDVGGLLAASRQRIDLTIVVLNNDGGGIFSHLPISKHADAAGFDEFFNTPHGLDLEHAASLYRLSFARATSWPHFRSALKDSLASRGTQVIEIPVGDGPTCVAHHRDLVVATQRALEPAKETPR